MTWVVRRARLARYLRLWILDVLNETKGPLTDAPALLNYLGVLILLAVLSPRWGPARQLDVAIAQTEAVQVVLWSLPAFVLLNAVRAVFRVPKQERARGIWRGDRFVYHEPRVVLTVLVNEEDNGRANRFLPPDDVPRSALVWYVIDVDRFDNRVTAALVFAYENVEAGWRTSGSHLPRGGIRLSANGKLSLVTRAEPNSTLTTVRVLITAWSVGAGIAM
jgi:hypothetical protein